jgi:hypothetical protein
MFGPKEDDVTWNEEKVTNAEVFPIISLLTLTQNRQTSLRL